jgi:hypothetical protein
MKIKFFHFTVFTVHFKINESSVAEPEPVERQPFAGTGAEVFFTRLRSRVYKFL